jgi:hypothetical protein
MKVIILFLILICINSFLGQSLKCQSSLECVNSLCCIDNQCVDNSTCQQQKNKVYIGIAIAGTLFVILSLVYMFCVISISKKNVASLKNKYFSNEEENKEVINKDI